MTVSASASFLPSVQTEDFEGPLDLLLDEVRRQNVALEKISMAPIVARFLEYMRTATERNLNLDIEWLHMAATLIQWKSRSLLPSDATVEPTADPIRDSLVQQLLAHRKQAAEGLARRRAVEQARFSRMDREFREEAGTDEPEHALFVSVCDLIYQAREISRWVQEHRPSRPECSETLGVEKDDVTVSDMIDYLRIRLGAAHVTLHGTSLIYDQPTPSSKASLFLAMLELVRDHEITLEQRGHFGSITIHKRRV
jgi:segregation and condensation protein A